MLFVSPQKDKCISVWILIMMDMMFTAQQFDKYLNYLGHEKETCLSSDRVHRSRLPSGYVIDMVTIGYV